MKAKPRLYYDEGAMRAFSAVFLLTLAVTCVWGADMPIGFFRGSLLRWDGTLRDGTLTAQNTNGVFDCHFDSKSYLELDNRRVTVDKLREGDPVEVLADHHPGESTCYVLTLEVVPPKRPVRQKAANTPGVAPITSLPGLNVIRHGQSNFAGVVVSINQSVVTLHTRVGDQTFQLRPDTRYFGDGLRMDRADVTANMRLSVEASRNRGGVWEAFQLTWGKITIP
ncbi:MAG: DUF5666 domain-containing protein [Acidobacteriota bacterium]